MPMTPEHYFETFVAENQREFHENPSNLRCAFNAAVSASHCADHYFHYNERHNPELLATYGNDLGRFVEHLSKVTNGAFRDVRNIANAYKHLYTKVGARSAPEVGVTSCGAIVEVVLPATSDIADIREDFVEPESPAGSRHVVVFTRKDGTQVEFRPSLDAAVERLQDLIYDIQQQSVK